jgi:hypothetical protein
MGVIGEDGEKGEEGEDGKEDEFARGEPGSEAAVVKGEGEPRKGEDEDAEIFQFEAEEGDGEGGGGEFEDVGKGPNRDAGGKEGKREGSGGRATVEEKEGESRRKEDDSGQWQNEGVVLPGHDASPREDKRWRKEEVMWGSK